MGLFRRKAGPEHDPRPEIEEFWAWWHEHRAEVIEAAGANDSDRMAALVRPAVAAIDPGLNWELSPGREARYVLVVSGGGKPELRAVAERWFLAAPEADDDVEYAPTRLRDPRVLEATLVVDDFEVALPELVAGTRLDQRRLRLDVTIHHPLFPLLQQEARLRVAFLALDAALGEDDVERWIGTVEVSADAPIDAISLPALPDVIDQLRPGGDHWAVFKGTSVRGPVVATVRRPFARADRPLCDTHVAIALTYPRDAEGLPVNERVTAAIQQLEQQCVTVLGGDGPHVALVAHELAAGRAVVHVYVDGLYADPTQLKPVLATWEHGAARVQATPDPAWRRVGHLMA